MIIAVVGSGGKTTRIHKLTEKYRAEGKKVFVTTTTHMLAEEGCDLSGYAEAICEKLESRGYCMAGLPAEHGKIKALPQPVYEKVCACADVVLVEADGSKGLPVKYPAQHEPVIPDNADEVHVVVGLSALGRPLKEVSHRKELVMDCLGMTEDGIIMPIHLLKLLKEGYLEPLRKNYTDKKIEVHPGQVNTLYERAVAQFLKEEQDPSVLNPAWFETKPKLVILGGGHVGSQVAHLGHYLDFDVTGIDDREEFANQTIIPDADHIFCHSFETVEELFPEDQNVFYVVVTRGHAADKICVQKILEKDCYTYVGMIGSRLKVQKTMEALEKEGFSSKQLATVHAPIGIRIGGRTPQEIALSIAAELVQEKNRKSESTLSGELSECREPGILCIITQKSGSSPRGEGSMMLVTDHGIHGSIGGGVLEKYVIEAAGKVSKICCETFSLSNEESKSLGMICGGSNQMMFVPLKDAF